MKNSFLLIKCLIILVILNFGHFINQPLTANTLTGFTLHFDFIDNWEEAKQLIEIAHTNGAEILNVIPPSQIWKYPESLKILKNIFQLTKDLNIKIVLSRIDGCPVSADDPKRINYLFAKILNYRGILPTGERTPNFFRETVGNQLYEKWLREETEYYSKNFSNDTNLLGFSIGLFNEPFVSQRGSLLCFDTNSNSYEVAQYTHSCLEWWQTWLEKKFNNSLKDINKCYATSFTSFSDIPMPKNEEDSRFEKPDLAYWDLLCSINDWVVKQYQDCRIIWKKFAKKLIPLILQFSGYVPEKLSKGRPAFAALDIYKWMQMADALGLSLYTNGEYPDWGHASDRAMVNFLYLGILQKKMILVMEGGSENKGIVLIPKELDFFANTARILKPRSYIYEFFKAPYYAKFQHNDGYIINQSWMSNQKTLIEVKSALKKAKQVDQLINEIYVYDDPQSLSLDNNDLEIQKQLLNIALKKTLIFIPKESLLLLPQNATLLVIKQNYNSEIFDQLKTKNIKIIVAKEWLENYNDKIINIIE